MEELPQLITDLSLILFCAGLMTLLFKKLNQPVVLGYIVAGFLAGPYMPYTQSIVDHASIHTWAEIGIIFLLFSLGLEFSFKKLLKLGSAPIIAVFSSLIGMIVVGIIVGRVFEWSFMDGLYLGGMMAMSSTSIIIKAFDELGLRQQKFASLVFSVLILEDIIAIVMMLLFGTLGEGKGIDGAQLAGSLASMVFYLVLWFVLGIYLIPLLLKKCKPLLNNETLLIVSVSLCFIMVVLATLAGFSAAFGAFVMGSILAETIESERIERIISPIKDLFGAIFFVSVGMMIDPALLVEYWLPILVITLIVLVVRSIIECCSFMLGGVNFKMSLQCGFSLAQVGEFSFIIAALGMSLGAISEYIYPIIVSVSVITTFTTPYMIRLAEPTANWLEPKLPAKFKRMIERYDAGGERPSVSGTWGHMLKEMLSAMLIYGVLSIAVVLVITQIAYPFVQEWLPSEWTRLLTALVMIVVLLPFLWALISKNMFTDTFWQLWNDRQFNQAPLFAIALFRILSGVFIVSIGINALYSSFIAVAAGVLLCAGLFWFGAKRIRKSQAHFETVFMNNLSFKEQQQRQQAAEQNSTPGYADRLLTKDVHLIDMEIPYHSSWCGHSIRKLDWGRTYDVHITSVLRNRHLINLPSPDLQLFPGDKVQLIGSDNNLKQFAEALKGSIRPHKESSSHTTELFQIGVGPESSWVGKGVFDCGIRDTFHCLIVGIDRGGEQLLKADNNLIFAAGDIVWIVGEKDNIRAIQDVAAGTNYHRQSPRL